MLRSLLILAFAMLVVLPSSAQDAAKKDRADYLEVARLAMEAQIKIGDALREKGDIDGAMAAYKKAVALFEQASRRAAPADRVATDSDEPFVGIKARTKRKPPAAVENRVELGLQWLSRHQEADGRWDSDKHGGGALYDVGVTSLSVMAFLGAGYTDRGNQPFVANVRKGLRFLLTRQDTDGCFGSRASMHFIYGHAMATLVVCEAYAVTKNPRYKKPAQDGLNFIAKARNPYMAWRYQPRGGENDTSVTVWCVMALKSGKAAGLKIDPDSFEGARQWIDKMTDPNFGHVGYNYPGGAVARMEGTQDKFAPEKSQAMTAAGVFTRIMCGEDPRSSGLIRKGSGLMLDTLPRWDTRAGSIDMYYWYLGTLAMFQVGGNGWQTWNKAMKPAIVDSQEADGSWAPSGAWGQVGGRIYATAVMTMCLEVYYRYDRVFKGK